jgi:hypothetical protein
VTLPSGVPIKCRAMRLSEMWNAEKQVQVNFIKVLGIVILCIASLAVLLAVVLPITGIFLLGPGVGIDLPFSAKVWPVFVFSYPWFSLVLGLGLVIVFGWAAWRLARGLRLNAR